MNTPAHMIFAAAAFAKPDATRITLAAIVGGLLPDTSLYLMVFWNRVIRKMSFNEIFDEQYFSPYWQQVFAIDNSLILWGGLLVLALFFRLGWFVAFTGSGTMHLMLDLPLHHNDGRAHFWPVSDWIFESPVSYWDPGAYGNIIGPLEGIFCLIFLVMLWRRFAGTLAKLLILAAGALELLPAVLFGLLL